MPLHAEEEAQGGRQQGAQHLVPQEKGAAGQVQVMMPSSCDALACIIDLVVWSACLSFSRFFSFALIRDYWFMSFFQHGM